MERLPLDQTAGGAVSLVFRWLGVAGLELRFEDFILAIDPFFTRPSLIGLLKPIAPDASLVRNFLPVCNAVLVTHSHWDHLLDVPCVLTNCGAVAYGSPNTCQLLRMHGIPENQVKEVYPGSRVTMGEVKVEVIPGRHSPIPFGRIFNGTIRQGIMPPLRLQDYRMDLPLGFYIEGGGRSVMVCGEHPRPAEVLFTVAQEPKQYYLEMLTGCNPDTVIPIHWDNFLRPLTKPLRRFTRPGRMGIAGLIRLVHETRPNARVIIPELFVEYTLG